MTGELLAAARKLNSGLPNCRKSEATCPRSAAGTAVKLDVQPYDRQGKGRLNARRRQAALELGSFRDSEQFQQPGFDSDQVG